MKISALWITKNEEENIARSIRSMMAVADEIVVVDTGSTDKTTEIAKGLGARIEHFEWINDFSAARNYALSKVDGDVVFFFDADEWIEPALEKRDRAIVEKAFKNPQIMVMSTKRRNVDMDYGTVVSEDHVNRILRGKGAVYFQSIIHEHPVYTNGGRRAAVVNKDWVVEHSGYNRENSKDKLLRNRELLDIAVEKETDGRMQALYHGYLMRENDGLHDHTAAFKHLQWMMENPTLLRQFATSYRSVGTTITRLGIQLAQRYRDKVSRRQLWNSFVTTLQEVYRTDALGQVLGLYYKIVLDFKEGELLAELPAAIRKAETLLSDEEEDYLRMATDLITAAGEAYWRRGDREQAFEHATKAIRLTEGYVRLDTITLLLRCMRGVPMADVIVFLNSILNVEKRGVQETLVSAFQFEGNKDLYGYYMKKMLDAGWAKKTDFWYLMIVLGSAKEAAAAAWEARETTEESDVQKIIFLAVACTDSAELYDMYAGNLGRYDAFLGLYFHDTKPDRLDFGIMVSNYQLIAFAAGRERANQLLKAFSGFERRSFTTQYSYYYGSGLFAEFLEENFYGVPIEDRYGNYDLAEMNILCRRYDEAFRILKAQINFGAEAGGRFFNLMAVIAENAEDEELRREANDIMGGFQPLYDEFVDWRDVCNTKVVLNPDGKKARKNLTEMTEEQLDKMVVPARFPVFKNQLEVARRAGEIYSENKQYVAALKCYVRVMEYDGMTKEDYSTLAGVFEQVGNSELAQVMWNRAKDAKEAEKKPEGTVHKFAVVEKPAKGEDAEGEETAAAEADEAAKADEDTEHKE